MIGLGPRIECSMLGEFFGLDHEIPECRGCACCGTSESDRCLLHARAAKFGGQGPAANASLSERLVALAKDTGQVPPRTRADALYVCEKARQMWIASSGFRTRAEELIAELRRPVLKDMSIPREF